MPRLYPKMSERPEEFRVNRAWPYYHNLAFAYIPTTQQILRPQEISPYERIATPSSGLTTTNVLYDAFLRRFAFHSGTNTQFLNFGTGRLAITNVYTILGWGRLLAAPSAYTRMLAKHQGGQYGFFGSLIGGGTSPYNRPGTGYSTNRSDWNVAIAGNDTVPVPLTWYALAFTREVTTLRLFINGKHYVGGDFPKTGLPSGNVYQASQEIRVGSDQVVGGHTFQAAQYADVMLLNTVLPPYAVAEIHDPSNVDLRVSSIPLILPPRRRYWPVVSEQALPKMVPWHLFQQVGV